MIEPRVGSYGVVKSTGIFARLIQIGTISRWNHAFIYIGDGKIVEANPRGVEVSPLSKYSLVAWNKHESMTDWEGKAVADYALKQVGKPYNFLLIGNLLLRIIFLKALARTHLLYKMAQNDGYICSELVAESYAEAGLHIADKAPDLVTPGDLAERLVYA